MLEPYNVDEDVSELWYDYNKDILFWRQTDGSCWRQQLDLGVRPLQYFPRKKIAKIPSSASEISSEHIQVKFDGALSDKQQYGGFIKLSKFSPS